MKSRIKKIVDIFLFNFKYNHFQIIGWIIVLFSLSFLYMILFPSVKELAQEKLDMIPDELLGLIGMDGLTNLTEFQNYFSMVFSIILIAISIFSTTFASSILSYEETNKTIEFSGTMEVSRIEFFIAKILTGVMALCLVLLATFLGIIIPGLINGGATFNFFAVFNAFKLSSVTSFIFLSIGFLISGITSKKNPVMISVIVLLIIYFLGYLGNLLKDNGLFLFYLSPFNTLSPSRVLNLNLTEKIILSIYLLITWISLIVGGYVYNKRDFSI